MEKEIENIKNPKPVVYSKISSNDNRLKTAISSKTNNEITTSNKTTRNNNSTHKNTENKINNRIKESEEKITQLNEELLLNFKTIDELNSKNQSAKEAIAKVENESQTLRKELSDKFDYICKLEIKLEKFKTKGKKKNNPNLETLSNKNNLSH